MKNQNNIVFFIGLIVMITIAIQFYWNHLQYKDNKQQVLNEIQISLDNAIDTYYNELSKMTSYKFVFHQDTTAMKIGMDYTEHNQLVIERDLIDDKFEYFPEYAKDNIEEFDLYRKRAVQFIDSNKKLKSVSVFRGKREIDSIKNIKFNDVIMELSGSASYDSVYISQFQTMLDKELERKNFYFDFFLIQKDSADTPIDSIGIYDVKKFPFVAVSNSVLLPKEGAMELYYPDIFWITLKKGITGILLSFVLSVAVIFSLFYLLYISESKNNFRKSKTIL